MSRYTDWVERTGVPPLPAPTTPKVKKVRGPNDPSTLFRFSVWLTLICIVGSLIGAVVAVLSWRHNPAAPPSPFVNVIVVCVSVLAFYWFFALLFLFLRAVHQNAKAALAPIPSLQATDAQLRQEFPGYEPSLQDLLAVEARIKSQRNEAAVITDGLLIGAHLAARQASGKSLL